MPLTRAQSKALTEGREVEPDGEANVNLFMLNEDREAGATNIC